MARTIREANLSTRAARERLAPSGKPYFRQLDEGLHIGYRKGVKGAAWVVRWYAGNRSYKVETLDARPDDVIEADGETVLNWTQAQAAARKLFQQRQRVAAGLEAAPQQRGPYTVRNAVTDYLTWLDTHRKTTKDAKQRAEAFILPRLGDLDTSKLTAKVIRDWLSDVAKAPARLRTSAKDRAAGKFRFKEMDPEDTEAVRRRRSTANRVLTILKAALNHACNEGIIPSDEAWRRVKPFPEADAARVHYLTIEEAGRLLNVCEPEFRDLAHGALVTGARFGELAALEVRDFNPDSGTLHIVKSKSGKDRHIVLNDEGQKLFERLTAGRTGKARIFIKADGTVWGRSHQQRPFKEACQKAKIEPDVTFHELRHSWASLSIMAGAPLMVVAQNLGHADTRMVERHYGHLAESFVAETIRRTAPSFQITKETERVVRLKRAK